MDKIAFATVLDDKYIKGFFITLNSLLESSKNFNYDIVVLDWGDLSDDNKKLMLSFYDKIIFKKIDKEKYKYCVYDDTFRTWHYNCNYRFEIFLMYEYSRIVFFDCDIIFQLDTDELLSYNVDFGACYGIKYGIPQISADLGFDAGLMSIGKKYINQNTFEDLMKISLSTPPKENNSKKTDTWFCDDFPLKNCNKWVSDEPILNTYFLDKIYWLPNEFNMMTAKIDYLNIYKKMNLQFTGNNKPWFSGGLNEKFSKFVFTNILENTKSEIQLKFIFNTLMGIYNKQVENLKKKNIYIESFKDYIKPSYTE